MRTTQSGHSTPIFLLTNALTFDDSYCKHTVKCTWKPSLLVNTQVISSCSQIIVWHAYKKISFVSSMSCVFIRFKLRFVNKKWLVSSFRCKKPNNILYSSHCSSHYTNYIYIPLNYVWTMWKYCRATVGGNEFGYLWEEFSCVYKLAQIIRNLLSSKKQYDQNRLHDKPKDLA